MNMAATEAVSRPPPAYPGPNGGNLHARTSSIGPTSQQQDPGLHGTSQDPGPSSHPPHHVYAQPVLYVPAPPPPFLHYQWPMPFSYNPFAGFPGMGYGMVMPPFPPPPPYMEPPAYLMPHPHIPPVDYRRLLHPQVHGPSAPYQNPNRVRRVRLPQTGPIRQTVNSEVQTEPMQRGSGSYTGGSPLISSDSGRGTASNSPSPSSSSSQKRDSAEVESYTLSSSNVNNTQVKRTGASSTVKHGFNALHPTGTKTVQSCIRGTLEIQKRPKDRVGKENVPPCRNGHFNMWSVGSADSMVPVCSSSKQEEEVVKERRISVPDILMSWGGSTPQAAMLQMAEKLPQNDHQLPSYETEAELDKSVNQSPAESRKGPVVADCADANDSESNLNSTDNATHFKIPKLREAHEEQKADSRRENESVVIPYRDELLHSLNTSHKLPDNEQENGNDTNPHEDTTDITPYQISLNSFQMKRKMNESVWSVESLPPFIPTKEWLLQNSTFEPEVIAEITKEVENGRLLTLNDNLIVKASKERRQYRRCSSSDSVLMSDSWLIYSTPAEKRSLPKKPQMESEKDTSEIRPKQVQSMAPSEKDPLASPTRLPQSQIDLSTPTEEDVDKNRSSEPEANQSPNQESLIVNEQQEKRPCSPEQEETPLLNSEAGEATSSAGQLIVPNRVEMEAEDKACGNEEVSQLRSEQLCVPMADQKMAEVSPSKAHLVDCAIQCNELPECLCREKSDMGSMGRRLFKYPDMKKGNNGQADEFCMKGQMQKYQKKNHWRNKEKHHSQQEASNGCGKPGKSQGGHGRNPRY